MDLETAAAELYALPPAEFTAHRDRLAKDARAEGDRDLAAQVGALRKPTVAAWLVNQLSRDDEGGADDLARVEALGQELREAQAALQGPRIKELTRERQQLATAALRHARRIAADAGQQLTAAVEREVEETLTAAVADEQAALAVTSGRLTRALSYAGLGEVDLTAATATPVSSRPARPDRRPVQTGPAPTGPRADVRRTAPPERAAPAKAAKTERDAGAAAEAALAAAREAVATAQAEVEASAQAHEEAVRHEEETQARLARLQQELAQTRRDLAAATKATAAAARAHQARKRDAREARTAADRAERDLTRHQAP